MFRLTRRGRTGGRRSGRGCVFRQRGRRRRSRGRRSGGGMGRCTQSPSRRRRSPRPVRVDGAELPDTSKRAGCPARRGGTSSAAGGSRTRRRSANRDERVAVVQVRPLQRREVVVRVVVDVVGLDDVDPLALRRLRQRLEESITRIFRKGSDVQSVICRANSSGEKSRSAAPGRSRRAGRATG